VDSASATGSAIFGINTEYADDDTFDLDLRIERIAIPSASMAIPQHRQRQRQTGTSVLSPKFWGMTCFVLVQGCAGGQLEGSGYDRPPAPGRRKNLLVAEWWRREPVQRPIVALSDGRCWNVGLCGAEGCAGRQGVTVLGTRQAMAHG